jgi:hypothetical protein
LKKGLSMARRSARLGAADNDRQPVQSLVSQRIFETMAAAGPIPDELSIDSSHVKAHRSASRSKRGSLKKRSAARGAEERARVMLWPTIAADRSLSR